MKQLLLSLCIYCLIMPMALAELPKEVRADLLKDEIITAVRKGEYLAARRQIDQYRKLGVDMPGALLILEAKVSAKTRDWIRAKTVLEKYFNKYGKTDAGYAGALDLYKSVSGPAQKQQSALAAQQAREKAKADKQAELNRLRTQCDQGNGPACSSLGYTAISANPQSLEAMKKNAQFQKRGCELGDSNSCNNYGSFLNKGKGVQRDLTEAVSMFRRACDLNNKGLGCQNLALFYERGVGVKQNNYEARKLHKMMCKNNNKASCKALQRIPKSDRELRAELDKTCNWERIGETCWQAAEMYRTGKGGPVDLTRAYKLHDRACSSLYYKESCYLNGLSKLTGSGTKKDLSAALDLFNSACRRDHDLACEKKRVEEAKIYAVTQPLRTACFEGDAAVCTKLGQIYDDGLRGVPLDDYQASLMFQKACDGDHAQGCNILGYFYDKGEGVATDIQKAMTLYKKACTGGYAKGCKNVGVTYRDGGDGVRKSKSKAKRYFRKSCKMNYQPACDSLEKL